MNGAHDLGGMDGFGPVPYAPDASATEHDWDLRVFALAAAGLSHGLYGSPEFRHAIERIPPPAYLSSSYYERWLTAVATLLVERRVVTRQELSAECGGGFPLAGPLGAPRLRSPGPDVTAPRFRISEVVRVRNTHPLGHTRCPRYVRGCRGVVVRDHGPANLDDVEAHSDGRRLDPLYGVRFDAAELWGEAGEPGVAVHVDLFESYLEPA